MNPTAPVMDIREKLTLPAHRSAALRWLLLLSLALHLLLIASLLTFAPTSPVPDGAEALSVEFVTEPGGAAAQASVPAEAAPASMAAAAPAQQADTPPPTLVPAPAPVPDTPLSPPVQLAEAPSLAPNEVARTQTPPRPTPTPPPPEVPSPPPAPVVAPLSPIEPAELPPAERPLPTPPTPPPAPVAQAHPPPPRPPAPRPTPPRPAVPAGTGAASAATAAALESAAQARASASQAAANQAAAGRAAANGSAWMGRLKQWWDGHSFYPREASQTDEGGAVRVRIAIAPDGQITFVQLVGSSGSGVLDAAALAVFRGARLPPLPLEAAAGPAEVVVTLHYRPSGSGG